MISLDQKHILVVIATNPSKKPNSITTVNLKPRDKRKKKAWYNVRVGRMNGIPTALKWLAGTI